METSAVEQQTRRHLVKITWVQAVTSVARYSYRSLRAPAARRLVRTDILRRPESNRYYRATQYRTYRLFVLYLLRMHYHPTLEGPKATMPENNFFLFRLVQTGFNSPPCNLGSEALCRLIPTQGPRQTPVVVRNFRGKIADRVPMCQCASVSYSSMKRLLLCRLDDRTTL